MYKRDDQMRIEDFVFPYGTLSPENEWVVRHVSENPYLQHFIGLKEYSDTCPFGASTMVAFRKRFREEDIAAILEASIPEETPDDDDDQPGGGTLIMDATCCPADIAYPQDIELLNSAREKTEALISLLCRENHIAMPRTYRRKARKDYLAPGKSKKRDRKKVRAAIRKQLQYLRRDIGHIVKFTSWSGIESGMGSIPSGSWRTSYTETGRPWGSAKRTGSVSLGRLWAGRRRTGS